VAVESISQLVIDDNSALVVFTADTC